MPAGKAIETLTGPDVATAPTFRTVIVNDPLFPGVRLPEERSIVNDNTAGGATALTVLQMLFDVLYSPPPETVAELVAVPDAAIEIATVRTMGG